MNKKMILAGVGGLLLVGAAAGGALLFLKEETPPDAAGDPAAALPEEEPAPVFYHHVQPEFVVNLPGAGRARFLMVELSVATDDEEAKGVLDAHQPELRNDLLMLLGDQDATTLMADEGKRTLRESAREVIEALVAKHHGEGHVSDVYLTRFVIQ